MMRKLTMALISETQVGNIGDDWMYKLEAKVFCEGLKGDATIEVPKHDVVSGEVIPPYGSPDPVLLFEGECEDGLLLKLKLRATEVDMFKNDVGVVSKDIRLQMPEPGCAPLVQDVDLSAGVRESPGIRNLNAVFTLRVRFSVENVG